MVHGVIGGTPSRYSTLRLVNPLSFDEFHCVVNELLQSDASIILREYRMSMCRVASSRDPPCPPPHTSLTPFLLASCSRQCLCHSLPGHVWVSAPPSRPSLSTTCLLRLGLSHKWWCVVIAPGSAPPGANVVADPNLESTVNDADIIIFCAPHQVRGWYGVGWGEKSEGPLVKGVHCVDESRLGRGKGG